MQYETTDLSNEDLPVYVRCQKQQPCRDSLNHTDTSHQWYSTDKTGILLLIFIEMCKQITTDTSDKVSIYCEKHCCPRIMILNR